MKTKPYSCRLDEQVLFDIQKIAEELHAKPSFIINQALKQYVQQHYSKEKSSLLSTEIIESQKSMMALLEHRINNRSNQLLSSLAIQEFILAKVLAETLQVSPEMVEFYRQQAAEFMKENNRIFSLREMLE